MGRQKGDTTIAPFRLFSWQKPLPRRIWPRGCSGGGDVAEGRLKDDSLQIASPYKLPRIGNSCVRFWFCRTTLLVRKLDFNAFEGGFTFVLDCWQTLLKFINCGSGCEFDSIESAAVVCNQEEMKNERGKLLNPEMARKTLFRLMLFCWQTNSIGNEYHPDRLWAVKCSSVALLQSRKRSSIREVVAASGAAILLRQDYLSTNK